MEDEEVERIKERKRMEMEKRLREKITGSSTGSATGSSTGTINKPIEIRDDTLEESVRKYPLFVLDCWAPWCGPCRIIAPILEELAREYAGRVVFGKLNVDENPRTAAAFGIMAIPTLLIFKNGRLVDSIQGAAPKKMLAARIERWL